MNLNNIYNFKNPIRHFVNINNINFDENENCVVLEDLSWTIPMDFKVRKGRDGYRTLKMPNVLNFYSAYNLIKKEDFFEQIDNFDERKRVKINLETGDFAAYSYNNSFEKDLMLLCKYDKLLLLDIKSYYGRIYTHNVDFENNLTANRITSLNAGKTNGILMGTYVSLYIAEKYLTRISNEISNAIEENGIDCEFSYFSDDFYFFCNNGDIEKIKRIFDNVLNEHELEKNENKTVMYEYEDYLKYNVLVKYWKKVIKESTELEENTRKNQTGTLKFIPFANQLIYRMQKLTDEKLKRIFIVNFFKTDYFNNLDFTHYELNDSSFHQLCYLFKFAPEILIYVLIKFKSAHNFNQFASRFKDFLRIRYKESLKSNYFEDQLYYFYALESLKYVEILSENTEMVLKSTNQVLISYYIVLGYFGEEDQNKIKSIVDEKYWFQNYHLILSKNFDEKELEKEIKTKLVPDILKNKDKKAEQHYINFYKENIESKNLLINDIDKIVNSIKKYIELKTEEKKDYD